MGAGAGVWSVGPGMMAPGYGGGPGWGTPGWNGPGWGMGMMPQWPGPGMGMGGGMGMMRGASAAVIERFDTVKDGTLTAEDTPSGGLTLVIDLPASADVLAPTDPEQAPAPA